MYSILAGGFSKKSAKGVSRSVVKKCLTHADYYNALFNQVQRNDPMVRLASTNHKIRTVVQTKASLSCYDDKRYILPDGIRSLAHGHYLIT